MCFEAIASGGNLRVSVLDGGPRADAPAADDGQPGPAESGYGLGIVAAVATDWGVVRPR